MSPARKVDPALLEREYVYDSATPPISITALADKHGLARSGVADMARRANPSWYQQRKEIRLTIGEKVIDAMTDRWVETDGLIRDRMLEVSIKMLDQAETDIADGKIKVRSVRDLATVVAAIRTLLGDKAIAEAAKNPRTVIDLESVALSPEKLAEMLPLLKRLTAGEPPGEEDADEDIVDSLSAAGPALAGHARTDAPAGPAGTLQD